MKIDKNGVLFVVFFFGILLALTYPNLFVILLAALMVFILVKILIDAIEDSKRR